jgi:hypothetical protein
VLAALALSSVAPNVRRIEGTYEQRAEVLNVWRAYNAEPPGLIGKIEDEFRTLMRVASKP